MDIQGHGLERAMGRMLQIGVTVAALVILMGGLLYLQQNGGSRVNYQHFRGAEAGMETVGGILHGAAAMDARGVIGFGILLLIATPICRVIFGLVGFAVMRDWMYAVVSAIVLGVLLFSFVAR